MSPSPNRERFIFLKASGCGSAIEFDDSHRLRNYAVQAEEVGLILEPVPFQVGSEVETWSLHARLHFVK